MEKTMPAPARHEHLRPLTDIEIDAVAGGFVPVNPAGLTVAIARATRAFAEAIGGPLVRNAGMPTL
jgi:hypothetical protein